MEALTDYSKPSRMAPGLTRSALQLMNQGGSDKLAMRRGSGCQGGCVPLRNGSVLDVKRVSERLMVVRVIVGRSVLPAYHCTVEKLTHIRVTGSVRVNICLCSQMGWSKVVKEEFLVMFWEVVSGIDSGERLLICGNLNVHVGS